MPLGKPAITDPRSFDLRAFQGAVRNIRERIEFIESALSNLITQVNDAAATGSVSGLQQQIASINSAIAGINQKFGETADAVELAAVINASTNGILVKTGNNLVVTRALVEGPQIAINFADGVDAAPIISYEPTGTVLPLAGAVATQGFAPTVVIGP